MATRKSEMGADEQNGPTKPDRATSKSASNEPATGLQAGDEEELSLARKRLSYIITRESDQRDEERDDLRFLKGGPGQWDPAVVQQRELDKRPCLTSNQLGQFTKQIENDQRQNRPRIVVEPANAASSQDAKLRAEIIRGIEYRSSADAAYDTGFSGAARAGRGAWLVASRFCDPRSFEQELRIERIRNIFSVYCDPDIREADGSDKDFAFVTRLVRKDDHKMRWPGVDIVDLDDVKADGDYKNWTEGDMVRVADYYFRKRVKKTLILIKYGEQLRPIFKDETIPPEWAQVVDKEGKQIERSAEVIEVHIWKTNGKRVLERTVWPGEIVPVVQVFGEEIDVDGEVTYKGIIRDAKDPQRMYNYWITSSTETVTLLPKAPYIGAEGQFSGHEGKWQQANRTSFPYLEYRPKTIGGQLVPPPARQPFAEIPAGLVQMTMTAREDLRATTGMYRPADQPGPERSGKAIRAEMEKGDVINYAFQDNLSRAITLTGKILVECIPAFYDTERDVALIGEDGKRRNEKINSSKDGKPYNMISRGTFDVTVSTGPSYSSKRAEARAWMIDFMAAVPAAAPIIADLVARKSDFDDADQIADRLFAMLPPNIQAMSNKDAMEGVPEEAKPIITKLLGQLQGMQDQVQKYQQALANAAKQLDDKNAILATERYTADASASSKVDVANINAAVKVATSGLDQQLTDVMTKVTTVGDALGRVSSFLEDLQTRGAANAAAVAAAGEKAQAGPVPDGAAQPGGEAGAVQAVAP